MNLHANAKLGLAGRLALVRAIEEGCSLRAAAAAFSVSPATAHRWWHRWVDGGRLPGALLDRSSRPCRSPRLLAGELQERRIPTASRRGLSAIAEVSAVIDPSAGLSSEVMRAQIRSMVVDLLMLTGLPYEEAREFVPESMGGEEPEDPDEELRGR